MRQKTSLEAYLKNINKAVFSFKDTDDPDQITRKVKERNLDNKINVKDISEIIEENLKS